MSPSQDCCEDDVLCIHKYINRSFHCFGTGFLHSWITARDRKPTSLIKSVILLPGFAFLSHNEILITPLCLETKALGGSDPPPKPHWWAPSHLPLQPLVLWQSLSLRSNHLLPFSLPHLFVCFRHHLPPLGAHSSLLLPFQVLLLGSLRTSSSSVFVKPSSIHPHLSLLSPNLYSMWESTLHNLASIYRLLYYLFCFMSVTTVLCLLQGWGFLFFGVVSTMLETS